MRLPIYRLSRFGTGSCTKPIFMFSVITLLISMIFTTFLLSGCTSSAASIRKFYTVSFSYNGDSTAAKITTAVTNAASEAKDAVTSIKDKLTGNKDDSSSSKSDDKAELIKTVRVGYRGICVEPTADDWVCSGNVDSLDSTRSESTDPIDLVAVGKLYKQKISFTVPLWGALAFTCVAAAATLLNTIPFILIPPITRKVAAGSAGLAAVLLLGAMVLQQVTSAAVSGLVDTMGLNYVQSETGGAVRGFGWAAFALALAAFVGLTAAVLAEVAVDVAQRKAEAAVGRAVEKGTGGRVQMEDLEGLKGFMSEGGRGGSNGGDWKDSLRNGPNKPVKALSLAGKLMEVTRKK